MYVKYTFIKVAPGWLERPAQRRAEDKAEVAAALSHFAERRYLRTYSLVGLRADADLLIRCATPLLEEIHELGVLLQQTGLLRHAQVSYSLLAVTKDSPYSPEPVPLQPRPGADGGWLIVYPMWKRRDWYALPEGERAEIMREHIELARSHPEIETNTAYSFGVDDQEFVVAFDVDEPAAFLDLVQELRATRSAAYTQAETPIFTCRRLSPARALDALDGSASPAPDAERSDAGSLAGSA